LWQKCSKDPDIQPPPPVQTIALAGASGFVGTSLRLALGDQYRWIALTRSETVAQYKPGRTGTEWRQCDLFSLPQVRDALKGADQAVYMVHSMLPSSRLVQGNFRDMDLLLADNFARAAEEAGVRRIIYLGGLIPQHEKEANLSPHLASRLEVEHVLQGRSIPVTVLRAGLIFGPGGSSARMLLNLTRRLPVMILPAWTHNITQSIDIGDVVRAIGMVLESEAYTGIFDLAGHPPMTYRDMILRTSEILGRSTSALRLPCNFVRFSRLWVSLFSGTPPHLVNPLLESLRHNLRACRNPLLEALLPEATPFEESVREAVGPDGYPLPNPRDITQPADQHRLREARRVRSIQRMPLPDGWSARQLSETYAKWISRTSFRLIRERRDEAGVLSLSFIRRRWVLLELTPTPFSVDCEFRRAYYITGGILARRANPPGRFELRIFPQLDCLIAAIHGYNPRLPWWLYIYTQALGHLAVMAGFGRYLGRLRRKQLRANQYSGGESSVPRGQGKPR
jgi:nucleoside-diphosphate-sugar epimerase